MPKRLSPKLKIHLDLLRPQSNPIKLPVRIIQWLLSTGRFIFIFVEGLVLVAFIARFKLDSDLTNLNDSIDNQIPYIESLKPYEVRIRQTQLKITSIGGFDQNASDYSQILKKLAAQTPLGVKISKLTMDKNSNQVGIQISGQAQTNVDVSTFVFGLKSDNYFSNVDLSSINLDKGIINFTINTVGSTLKPGANS